MFGNFLKKKGSSEKKPEETSPYKKPLEKKEEIVKEDLPLEIKTEIKKEDFDTIQSKEMGLDMKEDVKRYSKAFFNSKNKIKSAAYLKFESYLTSLPFEKRRELQHMTYLEFKEKETQLSTILKNGFSQFLSKGAKLDDETRETIEMVFGDVKKLPSKGHRYWYFKIFMWQKREEESK